MKIEQYKHGIKAFIGFPVFDKNTIEDGRMYILNNKIHLISFKIHLVFPLNMLKYFCCYSEIQKKLHQLELTFIDCLPF